MATDVTVSLHDGIGRILLDGAEQLNAIGSGAYTAIADAVTRFDADRQARAIVISGAGRVFSAGADIAEIGQFETRAQFHRFIGGFTDALEVLEASRLPIIAAIHGAALGGGLELALACDIRIATPSARLGLPEAKLGVLPGAGGTQRLPRLIGAGPAAEMVITGEPISGQRAHELGLVTHLASEQELPGAATQLAQACTALAPQVPAAAKRLLRQTSALDLTDGVAAEREAASDLFDSPDGREGFAAFRERRAPRFAPGPR